MNKENKQPGTEEAPSEDEKSSETDNETESETTTDTEAEDTAIADVQTLIDALPDADSITEDNVENVTSQLDAIDETKAELTEEEMSQLDLTRYDAAIDRVMALMGMAGAEENDSEIAVQANDSAGKTEQQSTDEASVTINGTTLYYATLEEAFSAADGKTATIDMLMDAGCINYAGIPFCVDSRESDITLKMNGKTLSGLGKEDYGAITVKEGSLAIQGPGTIMRGLSCESNAQLITVENVTFDLQSCDYGILVDTSYPVILDNVQIYQKAHEGAVYINNRSANVIINNMSAPEYGCCDVVYSGNHGLIINGGTFDKISDDSGKISVSNVLGEGCIYRNNEDKTWVTSDLSNTYEISNVTVEKIPLKINPEAEISWYYNSAEHSLQMNAEPTKAGNEITYEWYDGDKKLECTSDTYTVPKTMPIGSYTYTCKATCDGYTLSHEFTFTVEECKHENVEITFNSNGFGNCQKCNATVYQPAVETNDKYDIDDDGTKDTVYEISNAGQLYWFADKVNNDNATYGSANAVLTEDIVVNENLLDSLNYDADGNVTNGESFIGWACIGWSGWVGQDYVSNQYNGTFDGQNHTVSGLYFNDAGKITVGLFGDVYNDGSVSNVGVVDSYFYGYKIVGGVCGISRGTISNCYNTGTVSGSYSEVGGVCGYCWSSETSESYCYYLDTCAADGTTFNINWGKSKTASQFASGEVAYALNQGNGAVDADKAVWYQTLEGDSKDVAPTLKSTAGVVYQYTRLRCDGQTKTEDNVAYTNDSAKDGTSIKDEHKYVIDTGDHTHHKCSVCGETAAHTVGTPATCVSKAVCSVCSETFGEVDATNHVHTTVKNRKEATCTQTGYAGDTYCTDCDKLLSTGKELAALGHDYKATVTKQPTTTEEGIRTYTCTRCNSSYTESIAKLPEQHKHEYTETVTKEPTCTDTGIKTFTCSCGDSYTETIASLGHSYTSKVTKVATITEEGIMTYTCSKCGHSYTQPIAKIKSDDSNRDNGSQNQKPQSGTDNGNQNQNPQPDTDNGKEKGDSIKPYIKDDSGKEGWDVIKPQLEEAKSGDTVTVAMNGTTVVPKDVIDSIKGKDTTLVLDMENGLSWKIFGKDITDAAGDIDFDVTVGADAGKSIPVDVINNVTGERYSMNLTLAYDGEFGFTATLTVNMESKNAGLYANLFYYNEQTGELEFISAGQIDSDGNVELEFTHASDYTIVVDAKIMSDNGQADNKADETIPASKTDDSTSKYAWNNTIIIIIGICIILIVFGAVFYVRKKSGSEEE